MAAARYRLAAAIRSSPADGEFLVAREDPPRPLPEEEYRRFVDSDLWDLPSAPLRPLAGGGERTSRGWIRGAGSVSGKVDLGALDVASALDQVVARVGVPSDAVTDWELIKYVEEPGFGPAPPIHTLFVLGVLDPGAEISQDSCCKWMTKDKALSLLMDVSRSSDRIGPFVVFGLLQDSFDNAKWNSSLNFPCQEYPPGIVLVPMRSRTTKPFHTTNLVVMVPHSSSNISEVSDCIMYGGALLMDPGCCKQSHSELEDLVAALPRKLIVFVTHHHYDHIDGLSVVQKCNPDAILLAHEKTMNRIGKGVWSRGYTQISGGEKICIGGQILEAIFAPGHTDGHLSLLHVSTNSLIVGDHCVGQGSGLLDVTSGGNMKDYFLTTYKFLELSPHVLIPMHGRISLWPKSMLCGYLKNRRARELSILKVIESGGAQTVFDITSKVYGDVDTKLWLPASFNVRVHVEHLASQDKLPKDFSMRKFQASRHVHFITLWAWAHLNRHHSSSMKVLGVLGVGGLILALAVKWKLS